MDDQYWAALPPTLTAAELAPILRIGKHSIWRQLQNGLLPGCRLSNSWIVFRDEIRYVIERSANQPQLRPSEPWPDVLDGLPDPLAPRDLMELLGKSKLTILSWLESGTVPGSLVNSRWLIDKQSLRDTLDVARNAFPTNQ